MKNLVLISLLLRCILAATLAPCTSVTTPECTSDPSVHAHHDCGLFYKCEGAVLSTLACPAHQHFRPDLGYCLPASVALCPARCPENPIARIARWLFEKVVDAACPPNPTCGFFDLGVSKPYPPDCTKYIYCNTAGAGVVKDCAVDLHFSATLLKCVNPLEANCRNCGEEDPTTTTEETTTEEPTTTTEEATTTEMITTTLPKCPGTPTCGFDEWGVLKRYPPDCSKYIYCELNGMSSIRMCLERLHFSEARRSCVDPDIANCPRCLA